jgi:hypothetical protein
MRLVVLNHLPLNVKFNFICKAFFNRFTVWPGFLIEFKRSRYSCGVSGGFMRLNQLLAIALACLALCFSSSFFAVAAEKQDIPSNLEPLPEALPPPGAIEGEVDEEPQVTIVKKGEETIEEYRIHGELYMQKITPSHGVPYYLMREDQDGGWSRIDDISKPMVIPKWVIFRF